MKQKLCSNCACKDKLIFMVERYLNVDQDKMC